MASIFNLHPSLKSISDLSPATPPLNKFSTGFSHHLDPRSSVEYPTSPLVCGDPVWYLSTSCCVPCAKPMVIVQTTSLLCPGDLGDMILVHITARYFNFDDRRPVENLNDAHLQS